MQAINNRYGLDFTNYLANLKKFKFSDSLIGQEKTHYLECEKSVAKMTKDELSRLEGSYEYNRIGCGFDNSYRWIGGQELCDGVRVNDIHFNDKRNCTVLVEYFSINGSEKSFWGNSVYVNLSKASGEWLISNINL